MARRIYEDHIATVLTAVEFGFRGCARGDSMVETIMAANKIIRQEKAVNEKKKKQKQRGDRR